MRKKSHAQFFFYSSWGNFWEFRTHHVDLWNWPDVDHINVHRHFHWIPWNRNKNWNAKTEDASKITRSAIALKAKWLWFWPITTISFDSYAKTIYFLTAFYPEDNLKNLRKKTYYLLFFLLLIFWTSFWSNFVSWFCQKEKAIEIIQKAKMSGNNSSEWRQKGKSS